MTHTTKVTITTIVVLLLVPNEITTHSAEEQVFLNFALPIILQFTYAHSRLFSATDENLAGGRVQELVRHGASCVPMTGRGANECMCSRENARLARGHSA